MHKYIMYDPDAKRGPILECASTHFDDVLAINVMSEV